MTPTAFTYTLALIMGFTGSLHCAGMCGPIIWIMPFRAFSGIKRAAAIGLYHLGRISVYALFAIILHSFRSLFHPKWQQAISIGLGVMLLLVGIISFFPRKGVHFQLPWASFIKNKLGGAIGNPNLGAITLAGVMNGMLPCGLVYMALSSSMAATNLAQAALLMYAFGLGTLPMLVGITILKSKLSFLHLRNVRKFVPVMMFLFGSLFVLRGLNLGIPYLSPRAEITATGIHSCCCHK